MAVHIQLFVLDTVSFVKTLYYNQTFLDSMSRIYLKLRENLFINLKLETEVLNQVLMAMKS